MPAGPLPVVSYARISLDDDRDEHGVNDQHKVNRKTAAQHGWQIVYEFTDNDRSASKTNVVREEFERMLTALEAGRLEDGQPIRGVIVVAEDRLARRAGDYERFVDALTAQEGRVFADARNSKDLYSEDVEGMGLVGVAFSKIEARKIRRRMRHSHRSRAEQGRSSGGTRPFGWLDDRVTTDPAEAPLLAKAIEEFAAGRSINSIVREWKNRGVKTSLGNEWAVQSLRHSIGNPRVCGWRRLNGELVTDDEGQPVLGRWEPIVTPELWMAVDAIIKGRKGHTVTSSGLVSQPLADDFREHKHLLTGILRCGKPHPDGTICGSKLRATRQRHCVQHIYACPSKSAGDGCGGVARRGDKVDEFITEAVLAKLEERRAAAHEAHPWEGEEELARQQAKLSTLREQWQSDAISDELFFTTARTIEARIKELRAERGRHEVAEQRAATNVEDVRRRWYTDELDLSQKRAYVREALHAVIVHPSGRGKGSRGTFNPDLLEPIWRE